MVNKNTIEQIKFLWLSAITASGGLTFTLSYALIILLLKNNTLTIEPSITKLVGIFIIIPTTLAVIGILGYHLAYKSFNLKDEIIEIDNMNQIISQRFHPKRQITGLSIILLLLIISFKGVFLNLTPLYIYYALIMTAISYMIAIVVYNSTIAHIITSNINNKQWPEESKKGLYYNLYYKNN